MIFDNSKLKRLAFANCPMCLSVISVNSSLCSTNVCKFLAIRFNRKSIKQNLFRIPNTNMDQFTSILLSSSHKDNHNVYLVIVLINKDD